MNPQVHKMLDFGIKICNCDYQTLLFSITLLLWLSINGPIDMQGRKLSKVATDSRTMLGIHGVISGPMFAGKA